MHMANVGFEHAAILLYVHEENYQQANPISQEQLAPEAHWQPCVLLAPCEVSPWHRALPRG